MNLKYCLKQLKQKLVKKPLLCFHCSGLTNKQWRHFKQVLQSSSKTLYQPTLFAEQQFFQKDLKQHNYSHKESLSKAIIAELQSKRQSKIDTVIPKIIPVGEPSGSLWCVHSIDLENTDQIRQLLDSDQFSIFYGFLECNQPQGDGSKGAIEARRDGPQGAIEARRDGRVSYNRLKGDPETTQNLNHVDVGYFLSLNKETVFLTFIHALATTPSNLTKHLDHKV